MTANGRRETPISTETQASQLEQPERMLAAVREFHRLIREATDRDVLLEEACNSFTETWGLASAWIAMLDSSQRPIAISGAGLGESLAILEDHLRAGKLPHCALDATASLANEPIIRHASECRDCPQSLSGDERWVAIIPMHSNTISGVLHVSMREKEPTPDEVQVLYELGQDLIWAAKALAEPAVSQREEALRASEAKFSKIFFNSPILMTISALEDGRYIEVNDTFTAVTGYSRDQAIGTTSTKIGFISAEDRSKLAEQMRRDGSVRDLELSLRRANGEQMVCLYSGELLEIDGAQRLLSLAVDITERKRTLDALERRIVALTQPLGDHSSLELADLFNLDDIQKLQDEFAAATGVASIITDPAGTPITRPSRFCRLCSEIIRTTEVGLRNCYKSDAFLGRANPDGPTVQTCMSGGLWDAGASITVGGYHIANWLIGQVRNDEQSEEALRTYAREIGADPEQAAAAFFEVPSMSREQFENVAQMLFSFARQLSLMAYQNVHQARFIDKQKQAEARLERSEAMFRKAFFTSPDAVNINRLDDGTYVAVNQGFTRIMGFTEEDVRDATSTDLNIWCRAEDRESLVEGLRQRGYVEGFEAEFRSKDGSIRRGLMSATTIEMGGVKHILSITRDITEQHLLQERVRQMEKMDAIGQLAGGIAHDFNNQLAGIMGFSDLLLSKLDTPEHRTLRTYAEYIMNGARRSAELTNQLLAFSRRSDQYTKPTDVHDLIRETVAILSRSIDKRIVVRQKLDALQSTIVGDATQIQNSILNLAVNARDAMPEGGELSFETSNVELFEGDMTRTPQDIVPGGYVVVRVCDTGCGMPGDVLERAFEPFFTTKEVGKGTGMGLAAVYGSIRQHRGTISIDSELGRGTTVEVHFPLAASSTPHTMEVRGDYPSLNGLRVLVIDDEEAIRHLTVTMLDSMGCAAHAEPGGQSGLEYYRSNWEQTDLVILDVVMPQQNGPAVFKAIREINPTARILISSGFGSEGIVQDLLDNGAAGFLKKPFRRKLFAESLAKAMEYTTSPST